MTNEEKALELFPNIPTLECLCCDIRKKLVEMAEWKDQQFAKYLEERRLDIADTNCFSFEGILEFIEETEQLLKEGRLF